MDRTYAGRQRGFGHGVLWFFLTLGLYVPFWYYVCHRDMRRHSGRGLGGPWAALLFFLVSPVMMFVHSHEVGRLYVASGDAPPVTARTAWWILLPIVGSVWWFYRSNSALNAYWQMLASEEPCGMAQGSSDARSVG